MDPLLQFIKSRKYQPAHNTGILTADRYVKTLREAAGFDFVERYARSKGHVSGMTLDELIKKSASTLTFNDPGMTTQDEFGHIPEGSKRTVEDVFTGYKRANPKIELPKNTLMVVRSVMTTSSEDRDGDILSSKGAQVDPNMLLLWQHAHNLPIGKLLQVVEQNEKNVVDDCALVDLNELAHDAAVMIANKMGRYSHGFRALDYEPIKGENGQATGGAYVKSYEVMEKSLVSVPANPGAETIEVYLDMIESDKLTSCVMKSYGRKLREERDIRVPVGVGIQKDGTLQINIDMKGVTNGSGKSQADGYPDGKGTSTETETDDATTDRPGPESPVETEDTKGVDEKLYMSVQLPGTWEHTQEELRKGAKSYLETKALTSKNCWVQLVGTKDGAGIVKVENHDAPDSSDRDKYYQMSWKENDNGIPEWTGDAKEIHLKVTPTIAETAKAAQQIAMGIKSGRMLSKANMDCLTDACSSLGELYDHCSTRSGKALVNEIKTNLESVVKAATKKEEDETELPKSGRDLAVKFLAIATDDEKSKLCEALNAIKEIEDRSRLTAVLT